MTCIDKPHRFSETLALEKHQCKLRTQALQSTQDWDFDWPVRFFPRFARIWCQASS